MIARFCDLPVFDNHDVVCTDNSIEPVCDDQQRFAFAKLGYCLLDIAFVIGIHTGRRLIENDDRRVFENAPCNSSQLCRSFACLSAAMMFPSFITHILSAFTIVCKRCAMTRTVLPLIISPIPAFIFSSFSGSMKAVASSSTMTGAFFRIALAKWIKYDPHSVIRG